MQPSLDLDHPVKPARGRFGPVGHHQSPAAADWARPNALIAA